MTISIVAGSLKKGCFVLITVIILAILFGLISIWRFWTKDFYYGFLSLLLVFVWIAIVAGFPYRSYLFVGIPLAFAIATISLISARKERGYERNMRAIIGYFYLFIGCTAFTILIYGSLA